MTEEREHNPAPARKKPRFCEGCVLSALTVIAVRPPNDHSRAHATCFFSRVGWFNLQRNAFCGCCVSCALLAACRWRRCAAGGEDSARDQGELRGISEQRHTAVVLPERTARSWRRAPTRCAPAGHPLGCPPSSSTCIQPSSPTRRTRPLTGPRLCSGSHGHIIAGSQMCCVATCKAHLARTPVQA